MGPALVGLFAMGTSAKPGNPCCVPSAAVSDDSGGLSDRSDVELVATVEACEARRLELLAEIGAVHRERVAAVAALRARHSAPEVAALLGVSRQQVYRLLGG